MLGILEYNGNNKIELVQLVKDVPQSTLDTHLDRNV